MPSQYIVNFDYDVGQRFHHPYLGNFTITGLVLSSRYRIKLDWSNQYTRNVNEISAKVIAYECKLIN